jgi:hypothetical protein
MFIRVLPIKYIIVSCLAKLSIFLSHLDMIMTNLNPILYYKVISEWQNNYYIKEWYHK